LIAIAVGRGGVNLIKSMRLGTKADGEDWRATSVSLEVNYIPASAGFKGDTCSEQTMEGRPGVWVRKMIIRPTIASQI
jgi:hypothetical protein